jgi:hypothetical protein
MIRDTEDDRSRSGKRFVEMFHAEALVTREDKKHTERSYSVELPLVLCRTDLVSSQMLYLYLSDSGVTKSHLQLLIQM